MTRGGGAARRTARRLRSSPRIGGGGGGGVGGASGAGRNKKEEGVGPAPMRAPFEKSNRRILALEGESESDDVAADGDVDSSAPSSPRRCSDIDDVASERAPGGKEEAEEVERTRGVVTVLAEKMELEEEGPASSDSAAASAAAVGRPKRTSGRRKRPRSVPRVVSAGGERGLPPAEEEGEESDEAGAAKSSDDGSKDDEDDGSRTPSISSAVTDEEENDNDGGGERGRDREDEKEKVRNRGFALEAPSRTRADGVGTAASASASSAPANHPTPVLSKVVSFSEGDAAPKAEGSGKSSSGISAAGEGNSQLPQTKQSKTGRPSAPPMHNPLHNPWLLRQHLKTLKLESSLLPLRPVLSRLMAHAQHNRRGTFNKPVDAEALNLPDYDAVIDRPMDLGTVKARLHANSYGGPEEVADDVRLTFRNAMTYNPPGNPVHDAARALWELFEEGYASAMAAAGVEVGPPVPPPPPPPPPPTVAVDPAPPATGGPVDAWSIAMKLAGELAAGSREASEVMRPAFAGKTLPGGAGITTKKPPIAMDESSGPVADAEEAKPKNSETTQANGPTKASEARPNQQSSMSSSVGNSSVADVSKSQGAGSSSGIASGSAQVGHASTAAQVQPRPACSSVAARTTSTVASQAAPPYPQPAVPLSEPTTKTCPSAAAAAADATTTTTTTSRDRSGPAFPPLPPYRSSSSSKPPAVAQPRHSCPTCQGRTCALCERGCLSLEPTLLICSGSQCRGTKIRRGAVFYAAADGAKQWCQRCYSNLSAIIPDDGECAAGRPGRYKRDLLKRRNDEEVVEGWVECSKCQKGMHHVCAMYNDVIGDDDTFVCPLCTVEVSVGGGCNTEEFRSDAESATTTARASDDVEGEGSEYTFVSGSEVPKSVKAHDGGAAGLPRLDAKSLPRCAVSSFIERKVQERMVEVGCPPNAEQTLLVRVISDYEKDFQVPDVIRRHFRMETVDEDLSNRSVPGNVQQRQQQQHADRSDDAWGASDGPAQKRRRTLTRSSSSLGLGGTPFIPPPSVVKYQSKAIALFQRIDGVDVCVFCMYVQEYDGDETTDEGDDDSRVVKQKKRVYIAYLDSVEHFRPRSCRTDVYQEILVSYLASARARGYETAHIWACPPARGNSFVFWSHPSSQKTPTRDRLASWYHGSLSRALDRGVVTNVSSLYEHSFQRYDKSDLRPPTTASSAAEETSSAIAAAAAAGGAGEDTSNEASSDETIMICPPLLDGDLWVEEAIRAHSASIARHLKNTSSLSKPAAAATNDRDCDSRPINAPTSGSCCCPAIQVADLLHRRVLAHPSSVPFRRPVNAAALKLKDYHDIIKKPMDLGTVHSRILLGEFDTLHELVADVELVFSNAMRYNPKGHFVHGMAEEMRELFFKELGKLADLWSKIGVADSDVEEEAREGVISEVDAWKAHSDMSMRLSTFIDLLEDNDKSDNEGDDADAASDVGEKDASAISNGCSVALELAASSATREDAKPNTSLLPSASRALATNAVVTEAVPPQHDDEATMKQEPVSDSVASSNSAQVPVLPQESQAGLPPSAETRPLQAVAHSVGVANKSVKHGREESALAQPAPPSKRVKKANPKPRSKVKSKAPAPPKLDLLTDGPDAVAQRMVGDDYWLFDKNSSASVPSKGKKKRKKSKSSSLETDATLKKRKESWLGDEVGSVIRKMRRDFFLCDLTPGSALSDVAKSKCAQFATYVSDFDLSYSHGCTVGDSMSDVSPGVADARHALLEFSQYRNFQFDTLRRAKYSTAMLLYQLHHADAPGLVPPCGSCGQDTVQIRWHRIKKPSSAKQLVAARKHEERSPEELCESCYSKSAEKQHYIPIRQSFERRCKD